MTTARTRSATTAMPIRTATMAARTHTLMAPTTATTHTRTALPTATTHIPTAPTTATTRPRAHAGKFTVCACTANCSGVDTGCAAEGVARRESGAASWARVEPTLPSSARHDRI